MTIERREIKSKEEWLGWRRKNVPASNMGALFGVHPYCTALRLWAERRGVEFIDEDNKTLRRGRWLEPAVGKAVSETRPEWELEAPNIYLSDSENRIGATPDFFIHNDPRGLGVLQTKTVAPSVFKRDWNDGTEPPLWITLQCATEMMLADAAFGAVAVLLVDPHNMDVFICDVPRMPAAEAKIVAAVKEFWTMVAEGREPDPDFARDADVIKAMLPKEQAGKAIDLSGNNELPELLDERAALMASIKDGEKRCHEIETEVKFLMGDAEIATGLNGWRISFKSSERAGYTVPPKTLRMLRITDKRENKV